MGEKTITLEVTQREFGAIFEGIWELATGWRNDVDNELLNNLIDKFAAISRTTSEERDEENG